jgi:hypothetical protein
MPLLRMHKTIKNVNDEVMEGDKHGEEKRGWNESSSL